jgi:hypothetical protein
MAQNRQPPLDGPRELRRSGSNIDDHLTCLGTKRSLPHGEIEQQSHGGPSAGPKPEPMTVPRGASRSNRRSIRVGSGRRADSFQAGHASSILVTRSSASLLVNSAFNVPKLFEHPDDKNSQAGHVYSMIIGARCAEAPCQIRLHGPSNRVCEVDQAASVPNSCPISKSGINLELDPLLGNGAN